MVYHQQEKEALPILQKMDVNGFNDEEKSYYSLLLAMAQYKCYQPFTSDSAINEAVELAKRFSEPGSARFINGVLGAVSRAENGGTEAP